jgi:hypothetical protein
MTEKPEDRGVLVVPDPGPPTPQPAFSMEGALYRVSADSPKKVGVFRFGKPKDNSEPFEEKMWRLTTNRRELFAESTELEQVIRKELKELGHGF